jgi:dehydrogenase/reductase SDR family member 7B
VRISIKGGYSMIINKKIVWITGASSGIGEAMAYAFASKGAHLILSARNINRLNEVKDRCLSPEQHLVLPLDLADSSTYPDNVQTVLDKFSHIDMLINIGGISQRSFAFQTSLDTDRRIMETNFFGTVALTKSVLPSMLERGSGHIIVISSLMGKFGTPLRSTYSASKHALHGFFDSLRAELSAKGIKVLIVCPGFIRTNISINALCADGSCHGVMDDAQAGGMPPEVCAEKIIQAIELGKDEVLIGGKELLAVYLKRFAPGIFNRIIAKAKVT